MHIATEQHIGVKNRRIKNKSIPVNNVIAIVYIDPNIIKSMLGGDNIQRITIIKHKITIGKNVIIHIRVTMAPRIIPIMTPSTGTKLPGQVAERCGIINITHISIKIHPGGHIGIKRALMAMNTSITIPSAKNKGQIIGNNNHMSGKNRMPMIEYTGHSTTAPNPQWTTISIIAIMILIIVAAINNAIHNTQRNGQA